MLQEGNWPKDARFRWGHPLIAVGLSNGNPKWAREFFQHTLANQTTDGLIPPHPPEEKPATASPQFSLSGDQLTTPPVHGLALRMLYERQGEDALGLSFLREMYFRILRYHRYLYFHRDFREEGLVALRFAGESPLPTAFAWRAQEPEAEEAAAPYLYDMAFLSVLCWSNEALIHIGGILGEEVSEIIQWQELTLFSMNEQLWDAEYGHYNYRELQSGKVFRHATLAGLLPLAGGVPVQDQAESMLQQLESGRFGGGSTPYRWCTTLSTAEPHFDSRRAAAGAIDLPANWLLMYGLQRYDMDDQAEKVRSATVDLILRHGFGLTWDARLDAGDPRLDYASPHPLAAALLLDLLGNEET